MASINEIISQQAIDGIVRTDTAITTLDTSTKAYVDTVSKLIEQLKASGISLKDLNTAQKQSEKSKQKLTELDKLEIAAQKELDKELRKGIALRTKAEATQLKHENALRKTVKTEQDLINRGKALTYMLVNQEKVTVKGRAAYEKYRSELKQVNLELQRNQRATGLSNRGVGKYAEGIKRVGMQLMGALGITAGLYGLVRVFKSIISTSKEFEKQTATLAGVLDVEISQTKQLTQQAIALGGKYPTLAKEVLNLQTAYARLGFTQKEILNLTESTIVGSFALNSELGATAELVGAVVKSYDELGSSDAKLIVDQLTKSTQKSSLNFEALATALPKVAGAANALNIPLSETLAVLGTAIDATQDASIAGTSYRKILLSNAQAERSLAEGLEIINSSTNKVSTAQQLYGDRAAVVALALANQTEKTKELNTAIIDSAGVSERTAEKQMNTLSGSIDGVSSAWEKFTLTVNNSNGALKSFMDNLISAINSLTETSQLTPVEGLGGFFYNLFGFSNTAKKKIEEDVNAEYAYLKSLSLNQIRDLIPTQEKLIESYKEEGDMVAMRREERRLKAFQERLETDTANEIKIAEEKKKKLAELLANEEKEKNIISEKGAEIKKDIQKELSRDLAKIYLDRKNDEIDILDDAIDEQAEREIKANQEKLESQLKDNQAFYDKSIEDKKLFEEEKKRLEEEYQALTRQLIDEGIASGFSILQSSLDRKSMALEESRQNELSKVEGNKEAEDSINAKFDRKQAEINRKRATAEKLQALTEVAINTFRAVAAIKLQAAILLANPLTAALAGMALAQIPLAIAIGAVNAAAILAQPIPKFYAGTDSAPAGLISVGEKGRELIQTKSGQLLMATQPTITSGLEGAKIWKNEQTERILNAKKAGFDSPDLKELIQSNKAIERALRNQVQYSFETERIVKRQGNYSEVYNMRKLKGIG